MNTQIVTRPSVAVKTASPIVEFVVPGLDVAGIDAEFLQVGEPLPAAVYGDADALSPFMLGVLEAEQGNPCVPQYHYITRGPILEYVEGWKSVAKEADVHVLTDAEIAADHAEYVSYMADIEWMRHGL